MRALRWLRTRWHRFLVWVGLRKPTPTTLGQHMRVPLRRGIDYGKVGRSLTMVQPEGISYRSSSRSDQNPVGRSKGHFLSR